MEIELRKLFIDCSNIDVVNQFGLETEEKHISELSHNDLINDQPYARIMRFNSSAKRLVRSLQRVHGFGQLLSEEKNIIEENGIKVDVLFEHREACRDAYVNFDVMLDKVKVLCRYYFFMNVLKTDKYSHWYQALEQYKALDDKKWGYISGFLHCCKMLYSDSIVRKVMDIRNKDLHFDSPFDLIEYDYKEGTIIPVAIKYVYSNQDLHKDLVHSVNLLIPVISSLQSILENISVYDLYMQLEHKGLMHSRLYKVNERYKVERENFNYQNNREIE